MQFRSSHASLTTRTVMPRARAGVIQATSSGGSLSLATGELVITAYATSWTSRAFVIAAAATSSRFIWRLGGCGQPHHTPFFLVCYSTLGDAPAPAKKTPCSHDESNSGAIKTCRTQLGPHANAIWLRFSLRNGFNSLRLD